MKRTSLYLIPLFSIIILSSCSNDSDEKETGTSTVTATATTSNTSAPLTSAAKEKKSDVAVQRLKGKVEVLSESVFLADAKSKNPTTKLVFKYDENGNRTELSSYKSDGKLISTVKSTYDANGFLTGEQTIVEGGRVDMTSTIRTDAKGNRVEQQDKRDTGNPLFNYKHFYQYDEKGQLITRTAYSGNGALFFKYDFKYDDNGNKIEWIQTGPDNTVVGKVVYKFDEKNNMIAETQFRRDGSIKGDFTYSYDLDKKGNWIRQRKMQDNKVIEIKEREFKYH